MYFTIQRAITFFVGLSLVGIAILFWANREGSLGWMIGSVVLGLVGLYVVIASLIPYRKTTEDIADEVMGRVLIEIPIKLVGRLIDIVGGNF